MTLTNKNIVDLIKECDYYKDSIEMPRYIKPWKISPSFTYDKCWDLQSNRFLSNNNSKYTDKVFDYKINRIEPFTIKQLNSDKRINKIVYIIIGIVLGYYLLMQ